MAQAVDDPEDLASDPVVVALVDGLVSGAPVSFWGEGDVPDDHEPRLVLRLERGRIRMQGADGVDLGTFGNGDVAWRFMRPILMEQRKAAEGRG